MQINLPIFAAAVTIGGAATATTLTFTHIISAPSSPFSDSSSWFLMVVAVGAMGVVMRRRREDSAAPA